MDKQTNISLVDQLRLQESRFLMYQIMDKWATEWLLFQSKVEFSKTMNRKTSSKNEVKERKRIVAQGRAVNMRKMHPTHRKVQTLSKVPIISLNYNDWVINNSDGELRLGGGKRLKLSTSLKEHCEEKSGLSKRTSSAFNTRESFEKSVRNGENEKTVLQPIRNNLSHSTDFSAAQKLSKIRVCDKTVQQTTKERNTGLVETVRAKTQRFITQGHKPTVRFWDSKSSPGEAKVHENKEFFGYTKIYPEANTEIFQFDRNDISGGSDYMEKMNFPFFRVCLPNNKTCQVSLGLGDRFPLCASMVKSDKISSSKAYFAEYEFHNEDIHTKNYDNDNNSSSIIENDSRSDESKLEQLTSSNNANNRNSEVFHQKHMGDHPDVSSRKNVTGKILRFFSRPIIRLIERDSGKHLIDWLQGNNSELRTKKFERVPSLLPLSELKSFTPTATPPPFHCEGKALPEHDISDTFVLSAASEFLHSTSDTQFAFKHRPKPGIAPGKSNNQERTSIQDQPPVVQELDTVQIPAFEEVQQIPQRSEKDTLFSTSSLESAVAEISTAENSPKPSSNRLNKLTPKLKKRTKQSGTRVKRMTRTSAQGQRKPSKQKHTKLQPESGLAPQKYETTRYRKNSSVTRGKRKPKLLSKSQSAERVPTIERPPPKRAVKGSVMPSKQRLGKLIQNRGRKKKGNIRAVKQQQNGGSSVNPRSNKSLADRDRSQTVIPTKAVNRKTGKGQHYLRKDESVSHSPSRKRKRLSNVRSLSKSQTKIPSKNPTLKSKSMSNAQSALKIKGDRSNNSKRFTQKRIQCKGRTISKKYTDPFIADERRNVDKVEQHRSTSPKTTRHLIKRPIKWIFPTYEPMRKYKKKKKAQPDVSLKKQKKIGQRGASTQRLVHDLNQNHAILSKSDRLVDFYAYLSVIPSEIDELILPFRASNKLHRVLDDIKSFADMLDREILQNLADTKQHTSHNQDTRDDVADAVNKVMSDQKFGTSSDQEEIQPNPWRRNGLLSLLKRTFSRKKSKTELQRLPSGDSVVEAENEWKNNSSKNDNGSNDLPKTGQGDVLRSYFSISNDQKNIKFWYNILRACQDKRLSYMIDVMSRINDRRIFAIEVRTPCRIKLNETTIYQVRGIPCMELRIVSYSISLIQRALSQLEYSLPKVYSQLVFAERFYASKSQGSPGRFPTTDTLMFRNKPSASEFVLPCCSILRTIPVIEEYYSNKRNR